MLLFYLSIEFKAFTFAVRNCLEFRRHNPNNPNLVANNNLTDILNEAKLIGSKDPVEALIEMQLKNLEASSTSQQNISTKIYPECLLQNVDIYRLKALVYRDVVRNDRNKSKPFVIVVSVYCFFVIFFSFLSNVLYL
jgi:hypothetical protein